MLGMKRTKRESKQARKEGRHKHFINIDLAMNSSSSQIMHIRMRGRRQWPREGGGWVVIAGDMTRLRKEKKKKIREGIGIGISTSK